MMNEDTGAWRPGMRGVYRGRFGMWLAMHGLILKVALKAILSFVMLSGGAVYVVDRYIPGPQCRNSPDQPSWCD